MKTILYSLLMILLTISCKSYNVKHGDLLFVTAKQEGLSGAINNVTKKDKDASFDHIGLVQKEGDVAYVLHAAPKGGSQKQLLKDFLNDQSGNQQSVVLYRLKNEFQVAIPKAIKRAQEMLGKPYNFLYVLNEDTYYCSDFIERAFREHRVFELEPMTFKDPKTGEFNSFWKIFYKNKNMEIPEGELGCNPNGMANSAKIYRVTFLK